MSECDEVQKRLFAADHSSTKTNLAKQQPKNHNQKYVVPFGILSVFLTLYLTATTFKQTLGLSQTKIAEENKELKELQRIKLELPLQDARDKEFSRRKLITDKLLEHPHKCYDLEIFTKLIDLSEYEEVFKNVLPNSIYVEESVEEENRESEVVKTKKPSLNRNTKNGNNGKTQKRLHAKNTNGLKYNNKSVKVKNGQKKITQKKEIVAKKGSTAEPIIYLFALVFIYLLLKAASDINQHYKSQSKGDKRLRRCSLQSYAQAHKPDRRASKESPIKTKNFLEARSKSVDRYSCTEQLARKNEILMKLRKCTSVDEQQQQHEIDSFTWNFNLVNAHMTPDTSTECVDTMNIRTLAQRRDSMFMLPVSSSRRCSVPVSLNYQRLKLTTTPSTAMSVTARRTSISSGSMGAAGSIDSVDSQFTEVKRRVRMINRH